jgi:Rrf2 family protein
MVLRNQVEWALHCCSILAGMPPEAFIPTKDLAGFHGVPKEYLSKAMQALAQAGIVEATLGPTGGYRLARPAAGISFLDIVEAVEGIHRTFACTEIRGNNPCKPKGRKGSGICSIAKAMYRADEAWRDSLRSVTLESLGREVENAVDPDQARKNLAWFLER